MCFNLTSIGSNAVLENETLDLAQEPQPEFRATKTGSYPSGNYKPAHTYQNVTCSLITTLRGTRYFIYLLITAHRPTSVKPVAQTIATAPVRSPLPEPCANLKTACQSRYKNQAPSLLHTVPPMGEANRGNAEWERG